MQEWIVHFLPGGLDDDDDDDDDHHHVRHYLGDQFVLQYQRVQHDPKAKSSNLDQTIQILQ